MSKILRRPMFRGGGKVSSYGNGIATGLADGGMASKRGLVDGPGGYSGAPQRTYQNPYKLSDPVYASGYSAYEPNYESGALTGADVKNMAEKKVFGSMLGKDTVGLNQTMKDFMYNYLGAPLDKLTKSATDYAIGTEFNEESDPIFGNQDTMKKIYDRDVMPEATKLSNELITQEDSDDTYEEEFLDKETYFDEKGKLQFRDTNEVDLRNKARLKSYVDNAPSSAREEGILNKDYGELGRILDKQRLRKEEANRIKGGGQDAAQSDFEIPVGVTELEGEEEVGEIGFADMAEEYYNMMGAGADERMAERISSQEAKADERIRRARGNDISNTLLKVFEGSQQDGATVGKSLVEGSKYLTSKTSETEEARRLKDIQLAKLEDSGFNREESRRDRAGAMAFKDMMQDKQFNFSDVKSDKDFDRKMQMLEKQLAATSNDVEKRIIAARIGKLEDLKAREYAPGNTERDITWAKNQPKGSFEHISWLNKNKYAPTLEAQITSRKNNMTGNPMSAGEVVAMGTLYYDDWGGKFIQGADQKDGTYFDSKASEIITIQDGEVVESMTQSVKLS